MSTTATTTTTTTKTKPTYPKTTLIGMPSGTSTIVGDCDRDDDDSAGRSKENLLSGTTQPMTVQDAQRRIHELESQVRFYKVQSTGAGECLDR